MSEKQIELIYEAIRIIQRRSVDPRRPSEAKFYYGNALDILMYALNENAECLAQFDDVELRCEECGKFDEDGATAMSYERLSMCNACENHEFFEPKE